MTRIYHQKTYRNSLHNFLFIPIPKRRYYWQIDKRLWREFHEHYWYCITCSVVFRRHHRTLLHELAERTTNTKGFYRSRIEKRNGTIAKTTFHKTDRTISGKGPTIEFCGYHWSRRWNKSVEGRFVWS